MYFAAEASNHSSLFFDVLTVEGEISTFSLVTDKMHLVQYGITQFMKHAAC